MNYELRTSRLDQFPALRKHATDGKTHQIYFGLDAELNSCALSAIIDGGTPIYFGKHSRETIVALTDELLSLHHTIAVAQEACGFGYEFHRELQAAGAQSIIVAPEPLNGKRKTDKADSRKLAINLYSYLNLGNQKALRPIRVPTLTEQQMRALHRERAQIMKLRNQFAAHGRSLAVSFNWLEVPKTWWGVRKWPIWEAQLKAAGQEWLIERLQQKLPLLRQLDQQIKALEKLTIQELFQEMHQAPEPETTMAPRRAVVPSLKAGDGDKPRDSKEFILALKEIIPKGLGIETLLHLGAEACDWNRFRNRRQVGSFGGMSPSEFSSGASQKLGSIDRQGNAVIRTLLVEAAWRMVRFQPEWRGLKKHREVLASGSKASKTARRKAIVAVARTLGIDIWRLCTGRCQLEELGFTPAIDPGVSLETAH